MKGEPSSAEALRLRHRPETVRVLFLGESPPAGGTFFYAANSHLWRYTQAGFARAYGRDWARGEDFLRFFQGLGCFLDDLCLTPVNKLPPAERRRRCAASVPALAERLAQVRPLAIVSVISSTRPHVEAAIHQANLPSVPLRFLPFPTFGHQPRYVAQLAQTLQELRALNILA